MGINFEGVAVGAMQRGSEIIQEEYKKAEDLVDNSIKMWTEMGLPVYRARKKQRRELEQVADFLKGKGFSNDQIYTAMRQGKYKDVVDYVKKYETDTKKQFGANMAADVITFAPDYKDSGMTMDQILNGVMGKVNSGMGMADAIADATGKDMFGITGKIMQRRAGAIQSTFGIKPEEMMGLASGDFEYGEKLGGTITMPGTGSGKITGQAGRYGRFFRLFGNELGFKADYDSINDKPIYPDEAREKAGRAMELATEGNVIVAKLMRDDPSLTVEEAEQKAAQQILGRLRVPDTGNGTDAETGDGTNENTGDENGENTRIDKSLSDEEIAKVNSLSEQILENLDSAMGLPKNETERLGLLQQFIDLYKSFGFTPALASQMAQFQYDLVIDEKQNQIKERNRLERLRNIPMMSDSPVA